MALLSEVCHSGSFCDYPSACHSGTCLLQVYLPGRNLRSRASSGMDEWGIAGSDRSPVPMEAPAHGSLSDLYDLYLPKLLPFLLSIRGVLLSVQPDFPATDPSRSEPVWPLPRLCSALSYGHPDTGRSWMYPVWRVYPVLSLPCNIPCTRQS